MTAKTILVVDDDVDIRASLADLLEDAGYLVGQAGNGRDAIDYLHAHPTTSVVLLDLMMPMMNGHEFRTEQKRDAALASIPVIVMTAGGTAEAADIDVEVLQKPLKLPKLFDAIRRAEGKTSA